MRTAIYREIGRLSIGISHMVLSPREDALDSRLELYIECYARSVMLVVRLARFLGGHQRRLQICPITWEVMVRPT
jgi:hypothetical protein